MAATHRRKAPRTGRLQRELQAGWTQKRIREVLNCRPSTLSPRRDRRVRAAMAPPRRCRPSVMHLSASQPRRAQCAALALISPPSAADARARPSRARRGSARRRGAAAPSAPRRSSSAPSTTEPTGWIVSSIEVSAAGRRGSDGEISSQPSTCEVSASEHEPAVRRPRRHEVGVAERRAGDRRHDAPRRASRRRAGPARRRRSPLPARSDEDEARVGQPGGEPEERARGRVVAVGAVLEHARDQHDADQHDRQRGEHARAPGARRARPRRPAARSATCRLPSTVARPAPTSAIAWCQKIRSAAKNTPATAARRRSRRLARAERAVLPPGQRAQQGQRVGAAEDRRGRGRDVGLLDEDGREGDRQRAGDGERARARGEGRAAAGRARGGGRGQARRRVRARRAGDPATGCAPAGGAARTSAATRAAVAQRGGRRAARGAEAHVRPPSAPVTVPRRPILSVPAPRPLTRTVPEIAPSLGRERAA